MEKSPDEEKRAVSIRIQQPQPHDIVSDVIQIAGVAGGAFEASYNYVVTEGHDEVRGHFMAGDGVGGHGQFQITADVSGAAFKHVVAYVEVFHTSARDGSRLDLTVVPVILGDAIVPGYTRIPGAHRDRRGDPLGDRPAALRQRQSLPPAGGGEPGHHQPEPHPPR